MLALGVGQLTAQFANLVAFLPAGAAALAVHAGNGLADWKSLVAVLPAAVAASAVTSAFAADVSGELLGKLFGGFLVAIAVISLTAKALRLTSG